MKLVILVLCFVVEYYLNHRVMADRLLWLEFYKRADASLINRLQLPNFPMKGLAVFVLPALAVLLLAKIILSTFFGGVGDFLLSLVVFIACLGPKPIFYPVYENDCTVAERVSLYSKELLASWYAPVFWFLLLGAWGVLFYRLVEQFAKQEQGESLRVLYVLNWIPERMMALLFLLVGQFQPGSTLLIENLAVFSLDQQGFITRLVPMALGRESLETVDFESLEVMVYHANLALLTMVALFTLGSLF